MSENNRITLLLQFVDENPDDAFTKYLLALEYIKEGDDTTARSWLENVFNDHSDYLPNYYHYGRLLERTGDKDTAARIYRQGMSLARNQKDVHTYSELQGALEQLEE